MILATHTETGAPCQILSTNSVHHEVIWLETGGTSPVPVSDVHIVDVPVQRPALFKHGMNSEDIRILEDTFAFMTSKGWVIPEWIKLLKA